MALLTAAALTIAVPGIGHIWMNMLIRGAIWLGGNIAVLVILRAGRADAAPMLGLLGAVRIAALADLLITLRWARPRTTL